MAQRPKRIALFVSALLEQSNRLAAGVCRYQMERGGFALREFRFQSEGFVVPSQPPRWGGWNPDGIICQVFHDHGVPEWLKSGGRPVVNTSVDCPHDVLPAVRFDFHSIGKLAAEHFSQLGLKSFAYLGIQGIAIWRRDGFVQSLPQGATFLVHELQTNPSAGLAELEEQAAAEAALRQFLRSAPKPLGVFAINDRAARVALSACDELGIDVPGQVAVLGVGNSSAARLSAPTLSSIESPTEEIGYRAMELLDELIKGGSPPAEPIELPATRLYIRQSTNQSADNESHVVRAREMIRQRACEGLRVRDIVEHLAISRSGFERDFLRHVGRTPGQEILAVRLDRAKELLITTNMPITKIAAIVGYQSLTNFGEFFRKQTGCSPGAFRKSGADKQTSS